MLKRYRLWIAPISAGLAIFALVLYLWSVLVRGEEANMLDKSHIEATRLISYIKSDLYDRGFALERMARRWEIRGGTPKDEFYVDAAELRDDFPGYQAIEWIDPALVIRWVIPENGNSKVKNIEVTFEKNRRDAVEKAIALKTPTLSSPVKLIQNGKTAIQFYLPLFIKNEFGGFIVGVLDIDRWINNLLVGNENQLEINNYIANIAIDGETILQQTPKKPDPNKLFVTEKAILFGRTISVTVWPTTKLTAITLSSLSSTILMIGTFISFLIAAIIYLFEKAEISSKEAQEAAQVARNTTNTLNIAAKAGKIGIWSWHIYTKGLTWNDIMYDIYGIPKSTSLDYETWRNAIHPEDIANFENKLTNTIEGEGISDTEFRIILPDKKIRYVEAATNIERDTKGVATIITGTNIDITERKKNEEEIYHQANYDLLTGLPTRKLTEENMLLLIATANRNRKKVAVLFIDLDGFKLVNDSLGHQAGDLLLKDIASRLKSCVRKNDIVSRIGGDEFLIILSNLNTGKDSVKIAKMVIKRVSEPVHLGQKSVKVGASIGIAIFPDDATTAKALVELADKAMYQVKHAGKNNYAFIRKNNHT